MSRILIVITGQTGILNASLEMARRLSRAGHELHLAAPRPVGERITAAGWDFTELPEILMDPVGDSRLGKGIVAKSLGLLKRFVRSGQRRATALQNTRPTAFRMLAKRYQPDMVLIDIELHEYILAAHGMDLNFVLLSQWYSLWWLPGLPYLRTPTIPGVGPEGSPAAIDEVWSATAAERKRAFQMQATVSFGADRRSTLLQLARENGFPEELIKESFWPGVFSYDELPVIAMAPLEMEFPHEPRKNLHYVGPMVHAGREERPAESHRGEAFEQVVASAQGKQLIVVTVSTLSTGDAAFLARLVAAVAREPDWEVLLGLGGKLSVADLLGADVEATPVDPSQVAPVTPDLPANVHAFGYLPQLAALRAASLSVNHGGIHTIHECLHFEVPMLVYSGKKSDQPGCAARVHYHELGLMADKDTDSAAEIRHKISQVLQGEYAAKVRDFNATIAHYATDEVLERTVTAFLSR